MASVGGGVMGQWAYGHAYVFPREGKPPYRAEFSRRLSQAEYDYLAEAVRDGRWDEMQVYSKLVEASA